MSVNAIGSSHQLMPSFAAAGGEQGKSGNIYQVDKLNAEIKKAETEIEKTAEEVQKTAAESVDGASEKAQLLQNKILMQQQEILTKQMQVKKIEAPAFDRYDAEEENGNTPDNVYRLEEKDGSRSVIFNRPEESL